jgi:dihydroneopterin aldolase
MVKGQRMSDIITITGIAGFGYHGVFDHERREGQEFLADVQLFVSTREAARTDDLAMSVDYGDAANRAHAVLVGEPADLIETVAERISDALLAMQGVQGVVVTVHKPSAPIIVPFTDVSVTITRP